MTGMVTRERPTLEKVASLAGVSRATVSRVVNGSQKVAPEIRDAVHRAVADLGYVPNSAARSLVTQRTDTFALVVPEPVNRVFSDDLFFPSIVRGISQELEIADKQLLLMLATTDTSADRIARYAVGGHVDGVMLASMHGADPLPSTLQRQGVPVVSNGRPLGPVTVPYVDVDHAGGVENAVRFLRESGRKRIATIAGPQDMVGGLDRLAGYRTGLGRQREIVRYGDFTRESGTSAMRALLDAEPTLDAVFVASDLMAEGALRMLRQAGRTVPDDVAVVGFDDMELARYTEPALTTVRQPITDIGRHLVRQLLRLAAGDETEPAVILPTELIIRETT
jgi:DNA-binding LacI/PurR family transcriptional regulator